MIAKIGELVRQGMEGKFFTVKSYSSPSSYQRRRTHGRSTVRVRSIRTNLTDSPLLCVCIHVRINDLIQVIDLIFNILTEIFAITGTKFISSCRTERFKAMAHQPTLAVVKHCMVGCWEYVRLCITKLFLK